MPILDNREAHLARFEALRRSRDLRTAAFDMVGGGDYERVGFIEENLLDTFAPVPEGGLLVDVGCGPGRLAPVPYGTSTTTLSRDGCCARIARCCASRVPAS